MILSIEALSSPSGFLCSNSLCQGRYDGNYEISSRPNYFLQCIGGMAYCQACFPSYLIFSERCNQCLYQKKDPCFTSSKWEPSWASFCPDKCPKHGSRFTGNIKDPYNAYHYIACWRGVTVGCITCPAGLKFSESTNACIY